MTGKIFPQLSARRTSRGSRWRCLAGFEQSFPTESLFMDVEGGVGAGRDFVRVIEEEVAACDVMLVLIGPDWLAVKDDQGQPRLDNPQDFVRIEVEIGAQVRQARDSGAGAQDGNAARRRAAGTAQGLARRNAVGLTHERFKADAQGLIKALEGALSEAEAARCQAATEAEAAEERRAAEEAAKAEETARAQKERARLEAIADLSPELIAKAEELANWEFIKASESSQEFRDHLARFPQGVTERMARVKLEALVWVGLPLPVDIDALNGFLAEFPNGRACGRGECEAGGTRIASGGGAQSG